MVRRKFARWWRHNRKRPAARSEKPNWRRCCTRKLRERAFDAARHHSLCQQFEQDLQSNVWHWFPVTPVLLEQVRLAFRSLPSSVFLRASDALHLVCARESGFKEIYSNDRYLVAAASRILD
jgi:predicted nucleic acid-binding protein